MNLLVTGGAGFIGSNLIRHIIGLPEVTRLVNLDCLTYAGHLSNLRGIDQDAKYVFEKVDLRDKESVRRVVRGHGITHVMHLAAESHVDRSISGPGDFIQTNIVGTFNLLEAVREAWQGIAGDRRFLHVSTDEVYGSLGATGHFTETTPYAPNSPYSASKAGSEIVVDCYRQSFLAAAGVAVSSARAGNVIGGGDWSEDRLIPDAIRAWTTGQPLVVRYLAWLSRAVRGDLGLSAAHRVGVATLIGQRVGNTLVLAVSAMLVTWLLAIPLGVLVAMRRGRPTDRLLSLLAFLGMSVPNFFLAFLLLRLALQTGWFPVGGTVSIDHDQLSLGGRLLDRLHHLALPTLVLATSGVAGLMRLMRGAILDLEKSDFVRTARAKGLPERTVLFRHVLRNALNPFVTLAGYELGTLLGGAALVENVMNLQGLGSLMLQAVLAADVYLVMGSVLMGSILLLLGNLLADLALTRVDPRIDFSSLEAVR